MIEGQFNFDLIKRLYDEVEATCCADEQLGLIWALIYYLSVHCAV